jgi:hypothetical protein
VEGRGAATIHDVTVSKIPPPPTVSTSPNLSALLEKKKKTQKGLERCQKSLASLETYLSTLHVQHVDVSQIGGVMEKYDMEGKKLDEKVLELEKLLETIENEIKAERTSLAGPESNNKLAMRAAISVFAESAGTVEMVLIYGEYILSLELLPWC